MNPRTIHRGAHRLLIDEFTGNAIQTGRTQAMWLIGLLRKSGAHPYPMRFTPSVYNIGIARSPYEATMLRENFDRERAEIRQSLMAQSLENSTMKIKPIIRIEAELAIDDHEAELLHHLCSYDLTAWFTEKCSSKYSAEVLKGSLSRIRDSCRQVLEARNKAMGVAKDVS